MRNIAKVAQPSFTRPTLERLPARDELRQAVQRYGYNTTSYVLLEGPKSYFTASALDGFLAYQISAGVAVIGGDPVCDPTQAATLLQAFRAEMGWRPVCAYQVSPLFLDAFRAAGCDAVQVGVEAVFDLAKFTLAGGKMELVRAATNKARREGVVISEHNPFADNAMTDLLNSEIRTVSEAWLTLRGDREMGFLLGGLGLERPTDKRYWLARSGAGRIEGLIVAEPIYARNGYYLDVTRRRPDAVRGTMELLTAEIFRQLREEGFSMGSMGLAPLAQLDDPDLARHPYIAQAMRWMYDNIKRQYDFHHLYRYKAKYHPHAWEKRYLCFAPRLSPRMFYALLQVRDAFKLREAWRKVLRSKE